MSILERGRRFWCREFEREGGREVWYREFEREGEMVGGFVYREFEMLTPN